MMRGPAAGLGDTRSWGTGGFTLVRLLLALVVLTLLGALSRPHMHRRMLRARVEAVLEDLNAVRSAALRFHEAEGEWPGEVGRGEVPPELRGLLPEGFTFRKPEYTLDFENWSHEPRAGFEVALAFVPLDPEVGRGVMEELGSGVWTNGASKYTWIFPE